jgi:hypothetical protein
MLLRSIKELPDFLQFTRDYCRNLIDKLSTNDLSKSDLSGDNSRLLGQNKKAEETIKNLLDLSKEDSKEIRKLSFKNAELETINSILLEVALRRDGIIKIKDETIQKLQNNPDPEINLQDQISLLPEANQEQALATIKQKEPVRQLLALRDLFKEISREKSPQTKSAFLAIAKSLGFDSNLFKI